MKRSASTSRVRASAGDSPVFCPWNTEIPSPELTISHSKVRVYLRLSATSTRLPTIERDATSGDTYATPAPGRRLRRRLWQFVALEQISGRRPEFKGIKQRFPTGSQSSLPLARSRQVMRASSSECTRGCCGPRWRRRGKIKGRGSVRAGAGISATGGPHHLATRKKSGRSEKVMPQQGTQSLELGLRRLQRQSEYMIRIACVHAHVGYVNGAPCLGVQTARHLCQQ